MKGAPPQTAPGTGGPVRPRAASSMGGMERCRLVAKTAPSARTLLSGGGPPYNNRMTRQRHHPSPCGSGNGRRGYFLGGRCERSRSLRGPDPASDFGAHATPATLATEPRIFCVRRTLNGEPVGPAARDGLRERAPTDVGQRARLPTVPAVPGNDSRGTIRGSLPARVSISSGIGLGGSPRGPLLRGTPGGVPG